MSALQMELMYLTHLFFTSPNFALWLGMMISVAIFLGYFVFDDVKKLWSWLLVFLVYLIFQELLRYSYLEALPPSLETIDHFRPVFLVLLASFLFGIGLAIGGYISFYTRRRRTLERSRIDEAIYTIKVNGNGIKNDSEDKSKAK